MTNYTFLYENENGQLCDWHCNAISLADAKQKARLENPDIINCCIDIQDENNPATSPCITNVFDKSGVNIHATVCSEPAKIFAMYPDADFCKIGNVVIYRNHIKKSAIERESKNL